MIVCFRIGACLEKHTRGPFDHLPTSTRNINYALGNATSH
jgi:hypothetical protein